MTPNPGAGAAHRPVVVMGAGDDKAIDAVLDFLRCRTPAAWLDEAPARLPELLIDHANCEKKAAGNALSLLYRYVDRPALLKSLSRLAREELRHFEQVHELLEARDISYVHLSASRYASGLRRHLRSTEPARLVDTLLTGAVVEARSCERFLGLVDVLDAELGRFYQRLLASEARHFQDYLNLARRYANDDISDTLEALLNEDARLISSPDDEFRFHSGPPG